MLGKSTVSGLLSSKHNIPIIDADYLARAVILPGTRGYKAILSHFGNQVLKPDGVTLDRQAISDIVFNDERERKALNDIVHPAVRRAMIWEVVKCWLSGQWACILDVPLLIEAGLWRWVGEVVVVYVNEPLQLARLKARPSPNPNERPLSTSQALSRIKAQMPLTEKLTYADHVLDNSGTENDLQVQVDSLVNKWRKQSAGWTQKLYWLVPPLGLWAAFVTVGVRWLRHNRKTANKRRGRGENAAAETTLPHREEVEMCIR
ncbi:hypothetical protein QFC24_000303 [Naganishia onofrii]|uniref:Uncharacterized protein n=1 Tax=Naganishia onofrii TaxID=1851511 RepID=A0ACC2XWK9_9TREE|nr:hypothetical protein QFC24_000303 [Naganishia onofrii]